MLCSPSTSITTTLIARTGASVSRARCREARKPTAQTLGDLEQFSRHTEAHVGAYSVP